MESYHLAWLLCFLMVLMTIVSLYIFCLKRGCCDDCPCHQQGADDIDFAKYPLKATHYTAVTSNQSLPQDQRASNGHFNPTRVPAIATASVGTKTSAAAELEQIVGENKLQHKKHDPFVEAYLNYYSTISNVYRDHELNDAAALISHQRNNSNHLRAKSLTLTDPPKRKGYRNGDRSAYTGTISDTEMTRKVVPMERTHPSHSNLKKTPKSDRLRSSLTHLAAGHHYRPGPRVVTFVDEARWRQEEADYPSGFHSDSSPFTDRYARGGGKRKPRPYNIPIVKPNSMSTVSATVASAAVIHSSDLEPNNCRPGGTESQSQSQQSLFRNASSASPGTRNGKLSGSPKESPVNPPFRIIQRDNTKFRIITTPASISCHNTVV